MVKFVFIFTLFSSFTSNIWVISSNPLFGLPFVSFVNDIALNEQV